MSYIEDDQRRCDAQLSKVAWVIRSAKHKTTRKTSNFVNLGREVIDDGRRYAQLRDRDALSESGSDENEREDDQQRRYRLAEIRHDGDVTRKVEQARQRPKHTYDNSILKHEFYKTYIKTRVKFAARLLQEGVPVNDERS
jgi:hypothetical protein